MRSSRPWPFPLSAPGPRMSRSSPPPPQTKSFPSRLLTVSAPAIPTITSLAAVPTIRSSPFVPIIVAWCPKQVCGAARAGVAIQAASNPTPTRTIHGFARLHDPPPDRLRLGSTLDDFRELGATGCACLLQSSTSLTNADGGRVLDRALGKFLTESARSPSRSPSQCLAPSRSPCSPPSPFFAPSRRGG